MLSLDSMFGLEENPQRTEITRIPLIKLKPFENQPFKLYNEKKLKELAEDIKVNGLISPIVVRPAEDGMFQILAGHNRVNAFLLNQENVIDAIIKRVDDAEAELILVQSNLQQRQELSNSEKARAYHMRNKALKAIGKKNRGNHHSLATLAGEMNESQRTIARYIKSNNLSEDLMTRFDNNEFSVNTAEKLSILSKKDQAIVDEYLEVSGMKLNRTLVEKMCELSVQGNLSIDTLSELSKPRKTSVDLDALRAEAETVLGQSLDEATFTATINILQHHSLLKRKLF
ncbi:ParB/RepB/Spo0J family partition protein [Aerococcaceae bacterium NML160702]|nr:ParB/RepB/Spo0J family partition protein [Aerococcaceae bacterium NML160702]